MAGAVLYAGSRAATIVQVGSGYVDGAATYNLLAQSERIAPGGASGECIYTKLFVSTRHYTTNVSWWFTPSIDGVALATQTIALTGAATTTGIRQTHQLSLMVPYVRSAVEICRTAPRGTWFELLVQTQYGTAIAGKQIIESIDLEYEVVRGTQLGEGR